MPGPVNRLDLATRRGITAQTVIQHLAERAADQTGQAARNSDSIAERIGNAALAGLLRRFEEEGLLSPAASANGGMGMKDMVEAFKAVHEATRDLDDRQHQRMRELREENEALRARLQAQDGAQTSVWAEMLRFMAQMQQQFNAQMLQLIEKLESRTREMIEQLRQYIDRTNQNGPRIEQLLEEIRQANDPVVIARKAQELRQAFGLDGTTNHALSGSLSGLPLELLPEYWKADLERYRIKLQHERELREMEAAEKRSAVIEQVLKDVAARASSSPRPGSGAGGEVAPPKPAARYRYLCDACGREFVLAERAPRVRCPYCGEELEVVSDGHSSTQAAAQSSASSAAGRGDELAVAAASN